MTVPGTAAPQCGNSSEQTEAYRSGEQPARGWYSRGYLPHFDTAHAIQHITYRLADSLPQSALEQMQAELKEEVRNRDARETQLRRKIEAFLDAGHGSCVLRKPDVAACVVDTWLRFDGERYRLLQWVVMPNHCHVMIEPREGIPLGKIVLSWKNYTARWINENMSRTGVRRSRIWHREYWDRFIRDEGHFMATREYIVMNPVKAGLVTKPEDWLWSSAKD
ncbi:MAG: transposase [Coprothermobacterota bacterium]|nr:transposase [Coprothermobacterota bacterium]